MKHMRKLASLLLALVMVFTLATTAFADETPTTYTITAPENGHTYEVYQIFTGDLSGTTLSNVKWGKNGTGTEGAAVDQTTLDALTAVNSKSDAEKLDVIKTYVNLNTNAFKTVGGTDVARVSSVVVPAGYYLIKDKDNSVTGTDSYTLYIVEIVGDITISPKAAVPTFEKKLKDTNDSTSNSTSGWQDSADWDIGDRVPFLLKGTVASNYDSYKTYYFAFHDVEETGLDFDANSVKVYVDGTLVTSGYQVNTSTNDECTFEVIFSNLKNIDSVHAGSVITVEYESTLNKDANIGEQGNVNKAKLEFSNNPNEEQSGKGETGETPWDNVIVFTYKVIINKVDSENKSLSGAEFTLEKVMADGTKNTITVVTAESGTTFTFQGLDDGEYILTETKTPAGYNTIDPITFTVTADHTITWDGTNRTSVLTSLTGNKVNGEIDFTADKSAGSLSADVVNNAGSTLPETGGIGTTIFYVLGSVLVLAAVVLLVTKKRMSNV